MSSSFASDLIARAKQVFAQLEQLPLPERIIVINTMREALHQQSPFQNEPVDCVLWVPASTVHANDYNPNAVAPPEMTLLRLSIEADGFTQPVVSAESDRGYTIVDGYHRHRIGREVPAVRTRLHDHLPITRVRVARGDRQARITSTIRHNRARGLHAVQPLSAIVRELTMDGWTHDRIAKELGMDLDEVLRLKQVTGLAELFKHGKFSEAWE